MLVERPRVENAGIDDAGGVVDHLIGRRGVPPKCVRKPERVVRVIGAVHTDFAVKTSIRRETARSRPRKEGRKETRKEEGKEG